MIRHFVPLLSLALGCTSVAGSGLIIHEPRPTPDFTGVAVGSGIDASITVGAQRSAVLEGDDNILRHIKLEVHQGQLTARVDPGFSFSTRHGLRLTVVTPVLTSVEASGGSTLTAQATPGPVFQLEASGGSTVTVTDLKVGELKIESSGGSEVTARGQAKTLTAEVSGGGSLHAYEVAVESAQLDASGGASAYLQVSGLLTGEASGGSEVHLKGHPRHHDIQGTGGGEVHYDQ